MLGGEERYSSKTFLVPDKDRSSRKRTLMRFIRQGRGDVLLEGLARYQFDHYTRQPLPELCDPNDTSAHQHSREEVA